jgi:hypothetical protein
MRSLKRHGYTGRVVILIDNEDDSRSEYEKRYPGKVHVFDKAAERGTFDIGDNFDGRNCVVFARNACFRVARELGIDHFIMLDDDYSDFRYKSNHRDEYCDKINPSNLDAVFDLMVEFLKASKALTVCLAQGGDFIGGPNGSKAQKLQLWRKAMNTFVCASANPFEFLGRINEDVNAYVVEGMRGNLMFTIPNMAVNQMQTQKNAKGLTEIYLELGTYVKSFYSVMYAPSCVKVVDMGPVHRRIHHRVQWKNCVPCILSEEHKKS